VRELGGTAEAKAPVPTHGWFAGCTDSEGNAFSLWQADPTAG
jgi:predicted enzyme related to lactoylglutathione lyase